ncbi:MAG: Omp28-related outer membrane protein, partial [Candidatus Poseidoniales archaeon]|nr:Omp28-related outer membrane protein [Candidatus Poseidoniales archaeon]
MKKQYILLFILLLSSLGYISAQTIVSTTPENKNAIVEESTAIHCSYCPDGHAMLNQIIDQNPNDVFVIKFHEGGYAWDCDPNGGHDFNNALANQLGNMAAANGQPSASVNRQVFSNLSMTGGTAMSRSYWNTAISQVLQESSYVNVNLEAELAGNVLTIHVEAYYTASSPESTNYLHVAIMQDETVGPQLGGTDFNPSYVVSSSPNSNYGHNEYDYRHMDRLVDMVDGISGDAITTTSTGSFIDRTYTYTLPDMYNDVPVDLAEIEVAAFITDGDEIINGYKVPVSYLDYDVAIASIDSPSGNGVYSDNENIVVTLENLGENTVSNFDVTYQVNGGNTVTESFTGSIAYNETSQFTFYATYDFSTPGDYEIVASTSMTNDENNSNDASSTSFTSIVGGDCPDEYSLPIVWRDNFECHTEFAISDIGGWVMYDLDGGTTWGANDIGFTNESYAGTGIIYNHALATDETTATSLTNFDDWAPYEGNQGLYFFASGANSTTWPNDDWMISPEFTLNGVTSPTFSMWAKSVNDTYGLERFQVGVGNSTDYNDFTIISEGTYIEAPTNWTQYLFVL